MNALNNEAIITGRGSSALYVLLMSIDDGHKSILVPSNVCEVVIAVIRYAGYEPIYTDVDPISGNAELEHFQSAHINECKLLLAVPNFGTPINFTLLKKWAEDKGIFIIADLCNAMGASSNSIPLKSYGDAAIFSYGYAKIIEFGIGGSFTVKNPVLRSKCKDFLNTLPEYDQSFIDAGHDFATKLQLIRTSDQSNLFEKYTAIYNDYSKYLVFNLSDDTEKELRLFIVTNDLAENIKNRRLKGKEYAKINHPQLTHRPMTEGDAIWRYTMLAADKNVRDKLVSQLRSNGYIVSTWYPCLVEYFSTKQKIDDFPHANNFGNHVFNLFVDHRISLEKVAETTKFINQLPIL